MKTIAFFLLALSGVAQAAAAAVSVQLTPSELSLGDDAELQVTVNGRSSARPSMPAVDGLTIVPSGRSEQMSVVNGDVQQRTTYSFSVSPLRTGHLVIPPMDVGGVKTQALAIDVGPSGGAHAANQTRSVPSSQANPQGTQAARVAARLVLAKRSLFVGEAERVAFKAYFLPGTQVTITGRPMVKGGGFLLGDLSPTPRQSQETIGGQDYVALTWSGTLSAVKAGKYPLSVSLPATVAYREEVAPSRAAPNLFGDDDFFNGDDFFKAFDQSAFLNGAIGRMFNRAVGQVKQKDVVLTTESVVAEVEALPPHAPSSFSGAVGEFAVSAQVNQSKVARGDPLTLTMEVSGSGSFDRVALIGLSPSAEWKTYAATNKFVAGNEALSGRKIFEQAIVPLRSGQMTVPPIAFSYFDPQARRYVTRTSAPIRLNVEPGVAIAAPSSSPIAHAVTAPADSFAPNAIELGTPSTLSPLVTRPWFVAGQTAPPFLIAAAAVFIRRKRSQRDKALNAKRQRDALAAMDNAAARNNTEAFFRSARQALQCGLADLWHMAPDAITKGDIQTHAVDRADELQGLFDMADSALYTGTALPNEDLRAWQRRVREELRRLNAQATHRATSPAEAQS